MPSDPMRSGGVIIYDATLYSFYIMMSGEPSILNLRELPLGGGRVSIAQ